MKKLLILLFSLLISFNSYGKWSHIVSNDSDGGSRFYVDNETIIEKDNQIFYWELHDYSSYLNVSDDDSTPIWSVAVYKQLDCSSKRMKYISVKYYQQNMGQKFYESEDASHMGWQYEPPGSTGYIIANYVCEFFSQKSEWLLIGENNGTSAYVGETNVTDEFVYFWHMIDFNKPLESGSKSGKSYEQGDCKSRRTKVLSLNFYELPMGIGDYKTENVTNPEWTDLDPNSALGGFFEMLCDYIENNS